ncbi:EscU/YscU/HrcU family type III secretion system export apparatus switch protein [Acidimangrovimonas sediminis]|uniref:EscU/YscU/HrcU family type III secretion system export apparatus switch protein n=1 Tax=Acidimangrovimonas sediminis TaxID=2056283 RepID=UPI000C7FE38F|nr:flagellar type III secretion system protein FlhB [Acidimangrovimonas sediminis]
MSEDDTEKEHEPTEKRLEEARKRGEVPRSPELTTAAGYAGLLLAGAAVGPAALQRIGTAGEVLIDRPDRLAQLFSQGATAPVGGLIDTVLAGMAPFVLIPAVLVVATLIVQRAFTVTPEKLAPKLNRISPLSTAKNKFGRSGLFEFAKSFVKMILVALILGALLMSRLPAILGTMALSPGQSVAALLGLLMEFLFLILLLSAVMGGIDYLWQRQEHLRKNRMSRKDIKDEMKDSEGDPHFKQARRQRGYDIAMNKMLAEVPKADVVVVNPTHYAVALKWERMRGGAPICVAKGVDEIAARIREAALESGVPLHRDPPTARALHATVDLGQEIPRDQYRPVAAAIRFAEAMRAKARRSPFR